jgi:hypothetical protein
VSIEKRSGGHNEAGAGRPCRRKVLPIAGGVWCLACRRMLRFVQQPR